MSGSAGAPGRKGPLRAVLALGLAGLGLTLGLPACTGKPPEILRVFWQANLVEDREAGQLYQSLSLFIRPHDPDGFEDIEEVYLINDAEELFWRLDSSSWRRSGSGEETWIGSNDLRLPDGRPLPAGEYRILLRDAGGDTSEQTVPIQAPSLEQARAYLPQVSVQGGALAIAGGADSYQLWLYDAAGNFAGSRPASRGLTSAQAIRAENPALASGFSVKVYAYIRGRNLGVVSGPYTLSP